MVLYVDLICALGGTSLNSAGPMARIGLANVLGLGDQISNRVVDFIGEVSGGVLLHPSNQSNKQRKYFTPEARTRCPNNAAPPSPALSGPTRLCRRPTFPGHEHITQVGQDVVHAFLE